APTAWPTSWVAWFWNIVMFAGVVGDKGSVPGVLTAMPEPLQLPMRPTSGVPTLPAAPTVPVVDVARMMIQLSPMYQDVLFGIWPGAAICVHVLGRLSQNLLLPISGLDLM